MAELILNKDYGLTIAASIFTGIGLGQNDLAQMIGGMIVSPLANPIMESVMGGDVMLHMAQLIVMILTCVAIGMIYFAMFISDAFEPTDRMTGIADIDGRGYWSDIVYGLVAGMVVYASYGRSDPGDINVLAGLVVGVTILPAFVNAGMMFSAGLHGYRDLEQTNLSYYGLTSTIVGMIYLIFIFLGFVSAKAINENFGDYVKDLAK